MPTSKHSSSQPSPLCQESTSQCSQNLKETEILLTNKENIVSASLRYVASGNQDKPCQCQSSIRDMGLIPHIAAGVPLAKDPCSRVRLPGIYPGDITLLSPYFMLNPWPMVQFPQKPDSRGVVRTPNLAACRRQAL